MAGKSSGESVGSLCQIYEIQGMKKRHKKIRRAASDVKFKHFQAQFSDFLTNYHRRITNITGFIYTHSK